MDAHTLDRLEFDRIRAMVAEHASSSLGRQIARRIRPTSRPEIARQWLAQVAEMDSVFTEPGPPPFGGLYDVRDMIRRAVPPAKLEPSELAEVASSLNVTAAVLAWSRRLPDHCVELRALAAKLGDYRPIADQIHKAIDVRGRVVDDASPQLTRVRRSIQEARAQIRHVIDRLLKSPHTTKYLRYAEATFHNDRLVLPLAAEHRGRVPGIIHRHSGSGATLFVEPAEAVELNNTIVQLAQEENDEIGRILWHLTHLIHQNARELLESLDIIGVFDFITTKTRFARAYEMSIPSLEENAALRLRNVRHPLLLWMHNQAVAQQQPADPVVPIDVRLGDDFDLLVVTGPNTGGKTVAIKTIGLAVAMAHAGLPIAAEHGSVVPTYEDVLIDVGDEQSLQQSLSTFSAHLKQLLRMVQKARKNTLVLIDELGAGTDPDEGAAVGRAVVEEMLSVGCHTVVTTHLGALKSVAFTHPRADNAAVEFDLETLRPTYHLRIGEPGNSNALAIARRLGMPKRIIDAARQHLSDHGRMLEKAINGTLESRRQAERARTDAERARHKADEARTAFEQQRAELEKQRVEFQQWTQAIAKLQPGDAVHVRRFDRQGTLVRMQLQKQTAVVSVGAVELEIPLREISIPAPEAT